MSATTQQLEKKAAEEPIFKEILGSDLLYGFQQFAYNLNMVGLNNYNPSWLWEEMQWNPWLSMIVYRDLELKDDVIASAMETRKDSVLAKARRVLPASDKRQDKKVAEFVDETLNGGYFSEREGRYCGLDQILFEILDAVAKGVSIGEIIFGDGGDRVYISDVKFKPQHLFSFTDGPLAAYSTPSYLGLQTGPLRLRHEFGIAAGIGDNGLLPEDKFVVASYRPQYSNRWGMATLLKCFWLSWFKRQAFKQWLRYLEKGSGSVVSRYNDGAGKDEKNKALDAARAINEESAVAVPNKFSIEVMEHVRQSLGTAFEGLTDDMCNNGMLRIILGQTLTSRGSEGGGSQALGNVHQQVRDEKTEWDSKFVMHIVNKYFVRPIVFFKFGPSVRLPLWAIDYDPKRDLSADSVVHARLSSIGLPIAKKFFYESYQIPEPGEDEELLEAPANQTAPSTPSTGIDPAADFAEKKTPVAGKSSSRFVSRSTSKITRFSKLRPSMIESSSG
jgi:phage gp29-like protein